MRHQPLIIAAALLSTAQFVASWGADTHPTIGYLAERFLLNDTVSAIEKILANEPQFHGSVGSAANWADRQGRDNSNRGWHFVDANDNPPNNCSVRYNRDCPQAAGCVISAITNHTDILTKCLAQRDTSMLCSNALKYLVHFFGDITQPLHCSEKSLGGNQIFIKFDGLRRNLHETWDTEIPVKLVKNLDAPQTFQHLTDELQSRIQTGTPSFLTSPKDWVSCIDPTTIGDCAVIWATESNAFTCSFVYAQDLTVDLGGSYFHDAVPIVETQIAKAGLRFAVFMNLLVTGSPGWTPPQEEKFIFQGGRKTEL